MGELKKVVIETKRCPMSSRLATVISLIGIFSCLLLLVKLLSAAAFGLDFIDEGFYLNWIRNPSIYKVFTTQFGFIYHFIYQALNEDLVMLRQANILITYLLAFVLVRLWLSMHHASLSNLFLNATALLLASASLLILIRTDSWIATPYYNTLAFQGAILFFIGLISSKGDAKYHYLSVLLIGFGGWLMYMGKPPSAACLAITWVGCVLLVDRNRRAINTVIYSGLVSLLLLVFTALYVSGSASEYIQSLQAGIYSLKLFDAGHAKGVLGFFRVDDIYLSFSSKVKLFIVFISSLACSFFLAIVTKPKSYFLVFNLFRLSTVFLSLGIILVYINLEVFLFRFYLLSVLALVLGVALGMILNRLDVTKNRTVLYIPFMSFLTPYILSIGSNNNYWQLSSSASFFWLFSLVLMIRQTEESKSYFSLGGVSSIVFLLVPMLINTSQLVPYNQLVSLGSLKYPINLPNTMINVRKDVQSYSEHLRSAAFAMGFKEKTPMVDLTGHYGSSAFLLGASHVGLPAFFGGYKGSDLRAKFALGKVSCDELTKAWILIEPDGYRSISASVLMNVANVDIREDYVVSEAFNSVINPPNSRWGDATNHLYSQYLLKPINPNLLRKKCISYRDK